MSFARLWLASFFGERLGPRDAQVAARAEDRERGNLPVPPEAPSTPRGPEAGP
jgi:hypothetical protein